jgi:peptidoglycan hydrolase-like protein with peptidoglycan-binding domain
VVDARTLQNFLKTSGYYTGGIDGDFGPKSLKASRNMLVDSGVTKASTWPEARVRVAVQQLLFVKLKIDPGKAIVVDGIPGPVFQYALELYQNKIRDITPPKEVVAHQPTTWPRQSDIVKFFGDYGENQTTLKSPYPLYLDWSITTKVTKFSIHEKVHDSALRVMNRVLSHYGEQRIHELGLDQFGGCLNVRKMRGGNKMSMHSWGVAIDWDADRNQLRYDHKRAQMAKPEYTKFLDLWEEEGWISLGRERDYDWMHMQAARL